MRSTLLRIAVVATAAVLVLAGCAGGDAGSVTVGQAGSRGTIGIAMPNKTSPRWISDGENMQKQFKLLGYDSDLQYGNDDPPTQVSQIDAMVAKGDEVLVIAAIDGGSLKAVLEKAAAARIPVIAYDRLIRDTPNIDYYATFDNLKVGVVEAQFIVDRLGLAKGKGPFNIELFAGSADDNNAHFFFRGSMGVLKRYIASGKLKVRSGETSFDDVAILRWDGKTAQTRMARILAKSYGSAKVDAVLSPYDGLSRGILTALESDGYGSKSKPLPVVTGQDAELDSVKLIAAGKQTETVYKDTRELAKVAVQMVDSLLKGGTPEVNDTTQYNNGVKVVPSFLLQSTGVDKSNYKRILIDGGYYSAADLGN